MIPRLAGEDNGILSPRHFWQAAGRFPPRKRPCRENGGAGKPDWAVSPPFAGASLFFAPGRVAVARRIATHVSWEVSPCLTKLRFPTACASSVSGLTMCARFRWDCGWAPVRSMRFPRRLASATSSSTWPSRAPKNATPARLPRKWTPWAASSTPLPPRSAPAFTPRWWMKTCPWPSTCSPTWPPRRSSTPWSWKRKRAWCLRKSPWPRIRPRTWCTN